MSKERGRDAAETPAKSDSERERAERQAAALRENLRRRNAQRRDRRAPEPDSDAGTTDGSAGKPR